MSPDPDQQFLRRAEALLSKLLTALDSFDPDEVEADSAAGVMKMTFADGSSCVLNRQSAANQIWLAEGASAWHFEHDESTATWLDTKGRGELPDVLSGILTKRLGRSIRL